MNGERKYRIDPCKHCGYTLAKAERRGKHWMLFCDHCGSFAKIISHADKENRDRIFKEKYADAFENKGKQVEYMTERKQPTENEKLEWQLDLLDQFKEFLKFRTENPDFFTVGNDEAKEETETASIENPEENKEMVGGK